MRSWIKDKESSVYNNKDLVDQTHGISNNMIKFTILWSLSSDAQAQVSANTSFYKETNILMPS